MKLKDIEYPLRLCVELMHFSALGAEGKTEQKTGPEIKEAMAFFFTEEQIEAAQDILIGKNDHSSAT